VERLLAVLREPARDGGAWNRLGVWSWRHGSAPPGRRAGARLGARAAGPVRARPGGAGVARHRV